MKKSKREKLELIDVKTLIVGVDIAKKKHWANFMDFRLMDQRKPLHFENNKSGFECLASTIERLMIQGDFQNVLVGMEPTGHYWKALAAFLAARGIRIVLVNPHHVKKQKEAEDNTPNKNDKKDARIIAKMVRNGDFSFPLIFQGIWAGLRNTHNLRMDVRRKIHAVEVQIQVLLDQFFPEYTGVFQHLWGKASLYLLHHRPFPEDVLAVDVNTLAEELKRATHGRVGLKRAEKVQKVAKESVGLTEGLDAARMHLKMLLEQRKLLMNQLSVIDEQLARLLDETGLAESLLSIPGVGVVTATGFLGEIGNPAHYTHPRQLQAMAGLNLTAESSGQKTGKMVITKRGRASLRNILYQIASVNVAKNPEMKRLYQYLCTRPQNPLKPKQALIVVCVKMLRVLFYLSKKKQTYSPQRVLGEMREAQIAQLAA